MEENNINVKVKENQKSRKIGFNLLRSIAIVYPIAIIIAILYYPEEYPIFEYISSLGAATSINGSPNLTSQIIYNAGLTFNLIICVIVGIKYILYKTKLDTYKGIFLILSGIGAGLLFFPCDDNILNWFHRIGGILFLLGFVLFLFFCQFTRLRNKEISLDTKERVKFTFDKIFFILLVLISLSYLIVYLIGLWAYAGLIQKILLTGMFIGIFLLDKEDLWGDKHSNIGSNYISSIGSISISKILRLEYN